MPSLLGIDNGLTVTKAVVFGWPPARTAAEIAATTAELATRHRARLDRSE
jgi:hypothetical protein